MFHEREKEGWGLLLIDASNAFNTINRQAVLWNSRVLWPSCSLFLFNAYRGWVPLIVTDSRDILYSREGVTQGDPLSMFLYALATIPLIECVGRPKEGVDVWYADDASACGYLEHLKDWFVQLQRVGPSSYGYSPEPTKCVLVVNRDHIPLAHQIFDSFGVEITTSHRLLGGVVGDVDGVSSHIEHCVNDWLSLVDRLVLIARTQPQLAYSAFMRSVQSKWLYLQRVVPNCGSFFGCEISLPERTLFSLPARFGGLNVLNPTFNDNINYSSSRRLTRLITDALKGNGVFDIAEYCAEYHSVQEEIIKAKEELLEKLFNDTLLQLSDVQQRAVTRAKDEKISSWLTVLPVSKHHFDLSAPVCISVDGMLGKEAAIFVKRIPEGLSSKWGQKYSQVLGWIRTHLSFSILRATILCHNDRVCYYLSGHD